MRMPKLFQGEIRYPNPIKCKTRTAPRHDAGSLNSVGGLFLALWG
jgi:hypothetical protein